MKTLTAKRLILGVLVVAILNLGIGLFVGASMVASGYRQQEAAETRRFRIFVPHKEGGPLISLKGAWYLEEGVVDLSNIEEIYDKGYGYRVIFGLYSKAEAFKLGGEPLETKEARWYKRGGPTAIDLWGDRYQILYIFFNNNVHNETFGLGREYFVILREISE